MFRCFKKDPRKIFFWGAVLLFGLAVGCPRVRPMRTASGPMLQDAYLWQRDWNDHVKQSISEHASSFRQLAVLHAEVRWTDQGEPLRHVALDFDTLRQTGQEIGLCLRIGSFSGPFHEEDERTRWLVNICQSMLAEANDHSMTVAEIQIDFDCAESKLSGYMQWIQAIRVAIAPTPLVITALPSWLDRAAFRSLSEKVDAYVLQVHSVTPPKSYGQAVTLCDPEAAKRAVERAGGFGMPFRVALPTYGYLMAFDEKSKFVGLSAETLPTHWPLLSTVEEAWSEPEAIVELIRTWQHQRPECMEGLIWFRLPVVGDRMNWSWPTLAAVRDGRVPQANWECDFKTSEQGTVEVFLKNSGEANGKPPKAVRVFWEKARLVAGDAVEGFEFQSGSHEAWFLSGSQSYGTDFRPEQEKPIGWFALDSPAKLHSELLREATALGF